MKNNKVNIITLIASIIVIAAAIGTAVYFITKHINKKKNMEYFEYDCMDDCCDCDCDFEGDEPAEEEAAE